jgi:hypothetical protein
MHQPQRFAILPTLCLLVCLFALASVSPWLWEIQSDITHTVDSAQIHQSINLQNDDSTTEIASSELEKTNAGLELTDAALSKSQLPRMEVTAENAIPADSIPADVAGKIASQPTEPKLSEQVSDAQASSSKPEVSSDAPTIASPSNQPVKTVEKIDKAVTTAGDDAYAAWPMKRMTPIKDLQRQQSAMPAEPIQPVQFPEWAGRKSEPKAVAALPATKPQPVAPSAPYAAESRWREPNAFIESLNELVGKGPAGVWAAEALRQLRALGPAVEAGPDQATAALDQLSKLNGQVSQQAERLSDKSLAIKWCRAGYALTRRIDIWRCAAPLFKRQPADTASCKLDTKKLADCLAEIDALTGDSPTGRAWREYLLSDVLKQRLQGKNAPAAEDEPFRQIARRAIVRFTQLPLTVDQRKFLAADQATAYLTEVRRLAVEPIGVGRLLGDIEQLERSHLMSDARRLAFDYQNLAMSPIEAERRLADCVDLHYRNANVRLALTRTLANSLIPEQKVQHGVISDVVQGRPTQGETTMASEITIEMLPDEHRARIALVVEGQIVADTQTDAGAARFHSNTETRYIAKKPVEIDMQCISLWPVEVGVENDTQLVGVDTVTGRVPVLGFLTDSLAKQQYAQNKPAANEEAKQKITEQVTERVNAETHERFSDVVERLNRQVFDPLNSLALDPLLIDAKTTEERITMRLRVGGEDQLGGFTPRPLAPSDSLASVQINESVINNAIQRLQLDGRTFLLPELNKHMAASFGRPAPEANPDNDDVKITFAAKDAVTVRCQDGQLIVTVSIARLSKASRHWSNFQVRAFYQPEIDGRSARLTRDGVIRLVGPRLNVGSQIALRGIFSHTFSKKAPWELVPEQVLSQPKLKDTAITQFVIEDGWIGLALGPKPSNSIARRSQMNVR